MKDSSSDAVFKLENEARMNILEETSIMFVFK